MTGRVVVKTRPVFEITRRGRELLRLNKIREIYDAVEEYFAGIMLFIGLTLIFINVILRYFWGRPQSILDEFSVYFVVWGILAGMGVALKHNHHIKVDILYQTLSIKARRIMSIFANCLGLAFTLFYTYFGYQLVTNYIISGQRSADSQFPLWIVNLIMPISGILFSIRFLEKIYLLLKDGGKGWLKIEREGGHH
ncbi:TRAP-type C4-dicarboxylate transport system small permease component [Desulfocucumis palustris]|uniref:TRAP-type C4-dicarboxylate transport system small permease component n=1 Tax=Desulfocucumis palustris TaxID=1898651 RepID=A0A2L2XHH5_9FIRM|nr:TRAP-type C4-dicarboxylate transport system small permease component [Desulfocucumis palustris]